MTETPRPQSSIRAPGTPEPKPLPPATQANIPDRSTQKGFDDFTQPNGAKDRIFYIDLKFFRYGTNDKAHGAAVLFTLIAFVFVVLIGGVGFFVEGDYGQAWVERLLTWAVSAVTFFGGVAVGRLSDNGKDKDKGD